MPCGEDALNLLRQVGALSGGSFVPLPGMNPPQERRPPFSKCWLKQFHAITNTTGGTFNMNRTTDNSSGHAAHK